MTGPLGYENWLAANRGDPRLSGGEIAVFTDAHITGEIAHELGPYQLLNMIGVVSPAPHTPSIALRYWDHLKDELPSMEKTDVDRYHAGNLSDEIAALASLCMGIRLKAGGTTRLFGGFVTDPLGRPFSWEAGRDPGRPIVGTRPMLPRCSGQHNLNAECALLVRYPDTPAAAANALVRAARSYQEGIWIADSAPELAWLLLVSAIETVASFWRNQDADSVARMEASRPELLALLREKNDEPWVRSVADLIAPYMGATRTFVDFILAFLPAPPSSRSPLHHPWDPKALRSSLRMIYKWRSRALHGGIPFPLPMCEPPVILDGGFTERPFGLATACQGGIWNVEDTPMLLHLFEHIARGAILNWWRQLVDDAGNIGHGSA